MARVIEETQEAPVSEAGANGQRPRLLTREQILGVKDIAMEPVDVPEWGGTVMVRGLSGAGRDALFVRFSNAQGDLDRSALAGFRIEFVAQSIVDEDGVMLFGSDDIDALGQKSSAALERVFDAASRLSAVRPEDLGDITADLKGVPSASSGTD